MAGFNALTYAAAKTYTDQTVEGGGALKGKNCTVDSITDITGGHRVTFKWTLDNGTVQTGTMDVMDGVDGQDGQDGAPGADGHDGAPGADGLTPTIEVTEITGGHRVTITIGEETPEVFDVMDGAKGEDGDPGPAGPGVPAGGSQHQVLRKIDGDDYNTEWADPEGGQTIQVNALPSPSSTEAGKIYQYVGATSGGLTNGYFYKCVEDTTPGTYKWENVDVQAGGSGGSSTLAGLDDVDLDVPLSEGQFLGVNSSGEWENRNFPTLGTAAALDVAASGDAENNEVVKGNDSRLTDSRTPTAHQHTVSDITDFPTLGTAAALDVATTGDATTGQVVKGDDSRLTDARTPVAHQHTLSDITDAGSAAALDVPTSGNATTTQVVKGDDSRLTDARNAADVYSWAKAENKPSYTASEIGTNGVAPLNASGLIDQQYLPSYVDDIIEGYYYNGSFYEEAAHTTVITPETGKVYVDLSNNQTYRWGGSAYARLDAGLVIGTVAGTAYDGGSGQANADAISGILDSSTLDSFGDVETALGNKQDTISDLSDIRSGAAAGATAYQLPSGGITTSDLSSGVTASLGKADTAYQLPSGGITTSDLASGVVSSLGKADTAYQKPSGGISSTDMTNAVQASLAKADGAGYWVSGQDKTINSTLTTSIQFTVPDAGYGYDPYFESADGTPVYVQGENKSGTTLTYTIRALTAAQLPCKAKLLAIPVASA